MTLWLNCDGRPWDGRCVYIHCARSLFDGSVSVKSGTEVNTQICNTYTMFLLPCKEKTHSGPWLYTQSRVGSLRTSSYVSSCRMQGRQSSQPSLLPQLAVPVFVSCVGQRELMPLTYLDCGAAEALTMYLISEMKNIPIW